MQVLCSILSAMDSQTNNPPSFSSQYLSGFSRCAWFGHDKVNFIVKFLELFLHICSHNRALHSNDMVIRNHPAENTRVGLVAYLGVFLEPTMALSSSSQLKTCMWRILSRCRFWGTFMSLDVDLVLQVVLDLLLQAVVMIS